MLSQSLTREDMSLKVVAEIPADQKHAGDVLSLAWDEDTLYSGGEDCIVKAWSGDLKTARVVGSLGGAVMALAASDGRLWAAGMGSELRFWAPPRTDSRLLPAGDGECGVLLWQDGTLYAGDDQGNVNCFVENKLELRYNLLEEVKDLLIEGNRMYTVRDLDVTVTEFFKDSTRYMTLATLPGRAPLRILGDLLLVIDRTGKNILIYRNSKTDKFKQLGEVQVSDLIMTSLCVTKDGSAWTGGWDGIVRRWKREGDTLIKDKEIKLDGCINVIVPFGDRRVCASVEGGRIVSLEAD